MDKVCFVIMPITTPKEFIPAYRDDPEHFIHVMDCLFRPAIEMAEFKPIFPITQGSEIIHAEIISNIESADLVLCDMSILNPNVFFELGIRTALNKPVCLIKDNVIDKVPFDTNIINYHIYSPDLSSWIVKYEIEKLASHIKESFSKSNNCNSLWKYFSLKSIATPPEKMGGDIDKIEYLTMQVDAIRKQLAPIQVKFETPTTKSPKYVTRGQPENKNEFIEEITELLSSFGLDEDDVDLVFPSNECTRMFLSFKGGIRKTMPDDFFTKLHYISKKYGINIDSY